MNVDKTAVVKTEKGSEELKEPAVPLGTGRLKLYGYNDGNGRTGSEVNGTGPADPIVDTGEVPVPVPVGTKALPEFEIVTAPDEPLG